MGEERNLRDFMVVVCALVVLTIYSRSYLATIDVCCSPQMVLSLILYFLGFLLTSSIVARVCLFLFSPRF